LNDYLETLKVDFSKSGRGHTNLSKIEAICDELIGVAKSDSTYEVGELFKNISKYYSNFEIPEFNLFDAEVDLNEGTTDFQNQFKPVAIDSIEKNKALTDQLETAVKADLETEFAEITRLMQKNVPELEEIKTNVVCNWKSLAKFALSLKFTGDAFDIPLSHKGTGFKRLLMVAYFEYLAGKSDKKYQYFGIEEPETYLHPQLQSDLLSSIRALSELIHQFLQEQLLYQI
jgi:putative ATP-dependent endonuclease of OLD family